MTASTIASEYSQPTRAEIIDLAMHSPLEDLMGIAADLRDSGFGNTMSYSRKVFIPLTQLCRDVCHYCTFAQPPVKGEKAYMTIDEMVEIAREGAAAGCRAWRRCRPR